MKIMHVGKYYPPSRGGMETVLENITEGLLDRGCEVTVVVAGEASLEQTGILRGAATDRTGRLVRAGVYGHVNSQPLTLDLAAVIRREAARLDPDLVHLHMPNPLGAASWLALSAVAFRRLPPLAVWYHADITRQRLGRVLTGPLTRSCLDHARGIAVSSRVLKEKSPVLSRVKGKVTVIPFGIDPEPWSGVDPRGGGPFLFVGRLVPYKGLEVLLEALGMVRDAELVIIGDGPLRDALRHRAADLGIGRRVRFAGSPGQETIAEELGRTRALVLPSLDVSETFGLVQLEAMAAGVPVIASDLPTGVREVGIPEKTCLLVPPGDPAALAAALTGLIEDPDGAAAMGRAGRDRFAANFTRGTMVDRLMAWYETLLASHPGE